MKRHFLCNSDTFRLLGLFFTVAKQDVIVHLLSTNLLWALCLLSLPVKWVCSPDCTKCVSARNGFRRHSNRVAYSGITDLEHLIKNIQLPLTSRPASLKWCSSVSSCMGLQSKKKGEKRCIHFCPERVFVLCIFLQIFFCSSPARSKTWTRFGIYQPLIHGYNVLLDFFDATHNKNGILYYVHKDQAYI